MSVRTLLLRGMFAGLVGGLVVFGFLKVLGEEQVGRAIAVEESIASTASAATATATPSTDEPAMVAETEVVSRTVQSTVGLGTGTIVVGTALGGIYALAFAVAQGRIGARRQRTTAVVVALLGFVAVHLVPFLKYPANPPAIGDPDTLGRRTSLYFAVIAISVVASAAAVLVQRRTAGRLGDWNATLVALAGFAAFVALTYVVLPGVNEVPSAFPAATLWRFRLVSVGGQLLLWTTIGLVFGALCERGEAARRRVTMPTPQSV